MFEVNILISYNGIIIDTIRFFIGLCIIILINNYWIGGKYEIFCRSTNKNES